LFSLSLSLSLSLFRRRRRPSSQSRIKSARARAPLILLLCVSRIRDYCLDRNLSLLSVSRQISLSFILSKGRTRVFVFFFVSRLQKGQRELKREAAFRPLFSLRARARARNSSPRDDDDDDDDFLLIDRQFFFLSFCPLSGCGPKTTTTKQIKIIFLI
jgi:hypothetical protein